MKKYIIKNVETKEQLDMLYKKTALTIEGLLEESIVDFVKWLEEKTTFTKDTLDVYVTKGSVMNKNYSLHGTNSYPDNLNLVSVVDVDLDKIAVARFFVDGRWFNDIVDNNKRREREDK